MPATPNHETPHPDVARQAIPVMQPLLPTIDDVLPRLRRIDQRRWYTNHGPEVRELERGLASFLGVRAEQVVATASGTSALLGLLTVSPARRWVVPAFTFVATPNAVLASGGGCVLADIDPDTWWVDPCSAAWEPSDGSGLVAVAPFGAPPLLDRWPRDAEVVLDLAASLGSEPLQLTDLPMTWSAAFSLHATKALPAGEGGFAVLGDPSRAARLRRWIDFGFDSDRTVRQPGTNAKMPEVTAATANVALDGWPGIRAEWAQSRRLLGRALAAVADDVGCVLHLGSRVGVSPYAVLSFPSEAATLAAERALTQARIGTRRWWARGCHRMPAFQELAAGPLPVTDHVAATTLGVPMFRGLTREHAGRIAEMLMVGSGSGKPAHGRLDGGRRPHDR